MCANACAANSFFCGKHNTGKTYREGVAAMVANRRRELAGRITKQRVSISSKRAKKAAATLAMIANN